MELILAKEEMYPVEEFPSGLYEGEAVNQAENPLETNPALIYGILIGVLVVCAVVMFIRHRKKKK